MNRQHLAGMSRRALIGGALGVAASMTTRLIVGAEAAGIPAVVGGSNVKLRAKGKRDSDVTGSVPANAPIQVIAGPSPEGWYQVEGETRHGAQRGWTHGDGLVFTQGAVLLWDAGVFSGPTDAAGWLATIRHGVVVTVAGPGSDGFTFIRFGGLQGYVAASALQFTDLPATDPLG
ncbi:MAG TPA: SH3 domain-containing protein, partial [Thermomicrobiales bacterium]|nr:SH3 domain-containing protein [Thermomicrobiales bacterium]